MLTLSLALFALPYDGLDIQYIYIYINIVHYNLIVKMYLSF